MSRMPSLSLSGSGQPSSSSKPSLSSGSSGHLSTRSGMPSPSRSRSSESGQPSSSSKPFLVSGSFGHLSSLVEDAVVIVVGIGAAVLVLEVVEVFRLVGALVDVVLDAVAVAVADRRLEDEAEEDAPLRASRSCRRAG